MYNLNFHCYLLYRIILNKTNSWVLENSLSIVNITIWWQYHSKQSWIIFQKELKVDTERREFEHIFQMNVLQQQHQQVYDGSYSKSLSHSQQNHISTNDDLASSTQSSLSSPEMPVTATSSFKSASSTSNSLKHANTLAQIQMQYHKIMSQMQFGLPINPSMSNHKHATNDYVSTIKSKLLFIRNLNVW